MIGKASRLQLLILALVLTAFALRVVGLDLQSLWRDEVDALRFATRALPELLATFQMRGENGPLFFLALRPWLAAGGQSEFALRFPSAWAGTLAVPVIYILVKRLAGRRPALIAALLAATAPYLVWYGQEAKMYAALTVLMPLSLWATVGVAQRGGWRHWLLLYLVTTMCFYMHLLSVLVAPVQALWLLILPGGWRPARRWLVAAIYLSALFLPYLPLFRWQVGMWLSPFETGHPFVSLGGMLAVLAAAFSAGVLPLKAPIAILPAILAFVAGVGLWAAQQRGLAARTDSTTQASVQNGTGVQGPWRVVVVLAVWLFLPPSAVYAISLRAPLFTDRYLIWCMPAFLALAALGVAALVRVWRPLGAGLLGTMLVVNLAGVWAQGARPIKSDFRSAARFVLDRQRPGDLLLFQIPYNRYTFSYYFGDTELPWMDGPFTNGGATEAAVAAQMAQGTGSVEAVWLIASEAPMWDQRDLTTKWLSENGTVTDTADLVRVSVTRYEVKR